MYFPSSWNQDLRWKWHIAFPVAAQSPSSVSVSLLEMVPSIVSSFSSLCGKARNLDFFL